MIDADFKGHLGYEQEKTAKANSFLPRMMPNIGESKYSRRMLMVVKSIMLYASFVWERALDNVVNRKRVSSTYRPIAPSV